MLDPSNLAQLKKIQLKTKRWMSGPLMGAYRSAFKGSGVEFDSVRNYVPGDDLRRLDSHVSARMMSPYIKVFGEERDLTVMLLVDISASQRWGTHKKFKSENLAELAYLVACLAHCHQDRVGLMLYTTEVEEVIAPGRGSSHLWRFVKTLMTHSPRNKGSSLEAALEKLNLVLKRPSLVMVFSDFQDEQPSNSWKMMARKHEMIAVRIFESFEEELPNVGFIRLVDLETHEKVTWDTSQKSLRQAYTQSVKNHKSSWESLWRKTRSAYFSIDNSGNTAKQFLRCLQNFRPGKRI